MSRELAGNVANGFSESRLGGRLREIGIIFLLAAMLSSGKAFNSDRLDQPIRTIFWIIICTIIMGQIILIWRFILARWLDRTMSLRVFGCCLAAILSAALFSYELNLLKSLAISPVAPEPYSAHFKWSLSPILIMGLAYAFYGRHPNYAKVLEIEKDTRKRLSGPPKLLLLPGPVYFPEIDNWPELTPDWIQAQDHYLNCSGPEGKIFLRGRIQDASNVYSDGMRVHRSWWIRKGAIVSIEQHGRNMKVVLQDGMRIPVSRRYQAGLSSKAETELLQ